MIDTREGRLRKLRMRSWRRGMREVDLVLGPFADRALAELDPGLLDAFEALLTESDNDLYQWLSGIRRSPRQYEEIVSRIRIRNQII